MPIILMPDDQPVYLSNPDFDSWVRKFNAILKVIGLPEYLCHDDVTVKFSLQRKATTYGCYTIQDIKDWIRKHWGVIPEVEDILDGIHDYEDAQNKVQEVVAAIRQACPEEQDAPPDDDHPDAEAVCELFRGLEFEHLILGEYSYKNRITLYAKNIESQAADDFTAKLLFESTFIHELFHAYHYQTDPEELLQRKDYTSKVIKESLASCFEWTYCREFTLPGEKELVKFWEHHPVFDCPYSGALFMTVYSSRYPFRSLGRGIFCDVFKTSLKDMDAALRLLLLPWIFYKIKNAAQIREKNRYVGIAPTLHEQFETLMAEDRIAVIACREIPSIINLKNKDRKNKSATKHQLIKDLLDKDYCLKNFGLSYPVLDTTRGCASGEYRYYDDPIVIDGKLYYFCSQWAEKHRRKQIDWIWDHK